MTGKRIAWLNYVSTKQTILETSNGQRLNHQAFTRRLLYIQKRIIPRPFWTLGPHNEARRWLS